MVDFLYADDYDRLFRADFPDTDGKYALGQYFYFTMSASFSGPTWHRPRLVPCRLVTSSEQHKLAMTALGK